MEVSMHITEQCNLNCKACFHMIPISNNRIHWGVKEYIKPQLELLSKHMSIVDTLVLMGGEPTLHPDITTILYISRSLFPDTPIAIATNGSIISTFENPEFINALLINDIEVRIVEYPYSSMAKHNYERLYNILQSRGVRYVVNAKIDENYHFLIQPFRKDIDNDISQPIHCKAHHYCTMLKNGKLWVCHLAAYVDSLKDRFPDLDWINVDDGACVDLHDPDLTDEMIMNKLGRLSEICTHCVEIHRSWHSDDPTETTNWSRSERKKEEWVRE